MRMYHVCMQVTKERKEGGHHQGLTWTTLVVALAVVLQSHPAG